MASVVEDLVSRLIEQGVEKIAARKSLTSQDLTVLLLHQQSRSIARMEMGMERLEGGVGGVEKGIEGLQEGMRRLEGGIGRLEKGMEAIAGELRGFRQDVVPLLNQARDIAEIKARMERIESRLS